ncbi:MAG: GNAT family N-acetyltransferase [Pseudomonadales bacterium]
MTDLSLREAGPADVNALVRLINSVYRGDSSRLGWTTEADLLDGQRTDALEVGQLIDAADSIFLVTDDDAGLLACAHLARDGARAWLGMFAVRPGHQGQGLGRRFLEATEHWIRSRWGVHAVRMSVISVRRELIEYYGRRGYLPTGETLPFPTDPRFGIPKVDHLEFTVVEKPL